jgi:hypothetical protein
MIRSATIIGPYRYSLTRNWGDWVTRLAFQQVCFCQLNPSTADGQKDDPTLRRNIAFAKAWGFDRLVVVNLYAFLATDPNELLAAQERGVDVVGPENFACLNYAFSWSKMVVACWGAAPWAQRRGNEVLAQFPTVNFYAARLTKEGAPAHVLYLPGDLKPVLYRVGSAAA